MDIYYSVNNGIIKFYGDYKINKYIGYSLTQAKKQFRENNNLEYKHINFIKL